MTASISGTCFTDEGVTPMGAGRTVAVSVNGAAATITTTTASDGTFTLAGVATNTGNVLTVYLQGNTEVGVAVGLGNAGAAVTGLDIYQDGLTLSHEGATALSAANIATSDNNGATGISSVYTSTSSSSLVMAAGKTLYVRSGKTAAIPVPATLTASLVCRGTFTTTGAVTFTGSGVIRTNGSSISTCVLNASGTYTLADALTVTVMTLTAGTLDVTASNFQITCAGNWTATAGVFLCRGGTVVFNAANTVLRTVGPTGGPFNHLTCQGAAAGTRQVAADVTVGGNLTLSGSTTLDLNGHTLNVAGNFANSATFTASAGTVVLNGTGQTLSGSTTFYNLAKTVAAADTLTFTDGTTQTATNALTLQGASGQLLTLAGTSTGGWTLAVPATQTLSYLSVSYSTATGNAAAAGATSTDGGHNTNWTFAAASGHTRRTLLGVG